MRLPALLLLISAILAAAQLPQHDAHSPELHGMQQKLEYLRHNAAKPKPDSKPTDLTEREANAYFNEGGVKMPKGVSNLRVAAQPGILDAHAQVDFEAIMQGKGSTNPLLELFRGAHDVHIVTQASGSAGMGTIHVQSAYLDGIQVPQIALEFFAQHYITPRYPHVGVTSTFKLPLRIDSAVVEAGRVELIQK